MARKQRQWRDDAPRWIASVAIAAVLASAATSAVFLAVRPKLAPPPSAAQLAAADERQFAELRPTLEAAARAELARGKIAPENGPKQVDVVLERTGVGEGVPMVSNASNMLTERSTQPWQLGVTSTQQSRRFARVIDIRRSGSLRRPGYFGVVEYDVETAVRRAEIAGEFPAEAPDGFEVITVAKYDELHQTKRYEQQVVPPTERAVLLRKRFDNWQPVLPPPDNFPLALRETYHATLAKCDSAARVVVERRGETVTFYYSPQAGTWTPQPRNESNPMASR